MPAPSPSQRGPRRRLLAVVGPGLLVAATGVGAGDLATAAFTGSALGVTVLWAVVVGAGIKLVLNEGLARYQLVTGETLVEGVFGRAPRFLRLAFLAYFVLWSFLVGAALLSAAGAASFALLPLGGSPATDKAIYGVVHSLLAVVLVRVGGYRLFERAMAAAVGLMAVTVVWSAVGFDLDADEILRGLLVPTVPPIPGAVAWTVALLGGVGGTVTLLAYGYWIREEGRSGAGEIAACRLDLALGYAVTALFGLAMVVLGSSVTVEGSGTRLLAALGDELARYGGDGARLLFLAGAWAAIFSSILGVWQSAPYLFADLLRLGRPAAERPATVAADGRPYRLYLYAMGLLPCLGLAIGFARMQRLYAITGAVFVPLLAIALLVLNRRRDLLGEHRDRLWTRLFHLAVAAFFAVLFVSAATGGG